MPGNNMACALTLLVAAMPFAPAAARGGLPLDDGFYVALPARCAGIKATVWMLNDVELTDSLISIPLGTVARVAAGRCRATYREPRADSGNSPVVTKRLDLAVTSRTGFTARLPGLARRTAFRRCATVPDAIAEQFSR
jgi:hypothetical protein